MITKERLEELIEQEATIWAVYDEDRIEKIKLVVRMFGVSVDEYNKLHNCEPMLYSKFCGIFRDICPISWVFETREDAEWHKEFGCIERTERLEFPTWEEFIKNYQTLGDNTILDERCVMFPSKTKTYSLYADDNSIWVGCDSTRTSFFCEDLNKENYIKACRLCKRLFLGELDLGEKK